MHPHRRRILIVDDCPDTAESLALLLEIHGHEARCAFGGAAGLALAAAFRPEVIFLDLAMPGLDGWAVARRLRQEPALAGVLVVAVSGYGRPDDVAKAAAAGCDWHLLKPAAAADVLAILADPGRYRGALGRAPASARTGPGPPALGEAPGP
jgi:CheY-like chemotaxis protein